MKLFLNFENFSKFFQDSKKRLRNTGRKRNECVLHGQSSKLNFFNTRLKANRKEQRELCRRLFLFGKVLSVKKWKFIKIRIAWQKEFWNAKKGVLGFYNRFEWIKQTKLLNISWIKSVLEGQRPEIAVREFPQILSLNSTSLWWRHQKISFFQLEIMLSMKRTFSSRFVLVVIRRVNVLSSLVRKKRQRSSLVCSSTIEGERKTVKIRRCLFLLLSRTKKRERRFFSIIFSNFFIVQDKHRFLPIYIVSHRISLSLLVVQTLWSIQIHVSKTFWR